MKQYKVGEFAQNLGVSIGFLKHHERYGLLKPQVSESGYRYYQRSDGMQVLNCLKLQSMGFTSREISNILSNSSELNLPALLHERQHALEQQILLQQETLAYMRWMERISLDLISAGGETFTIEQTEPFYYLENMVHGEFVSDPLLHETAARWNDCMPLVEHCAHICGAAFQEGSIQAEGYYMGLCIRKDIADKLDIYLSGHVRTISLGRCLVYRYQGIRERGMGQRQRSLDRMLLRPLEICKAHNLHISGEIYSIKSFCAMAHTENLVSETVLIPLK